MTTFKLISIIFICTTVACLACLTRSSETHNELIGFYVGLQELCWTDSSRTKPCNIDPENPEVKWYHITYLKIKEDSVYVDQNPISIYKTDTGFSSSTGAFYYYSGTFQVKDKTITFNLRELSCDYCPHKIKINSDGTQEEVKRFKQLKGLLTDKGISINGYLFSKTTQEESI